MAIQDFARGRPLTNSPSRTCPCPPGSSKPLGLPPAGSPSRTSSQLLTSQQDTPKSWTQWTIPFHSSYLRPLGLSLLPHQSIPLSTGPLLLELNTTIGYLEPLLKIPPLGQSLPFNMGLLLTDSLTDFVATNAPVMAIQDLTQRISTN